jgi:hypothetical protein
VRFPAGFLEIVCDQLRDVAVVFGYQDLQGSRPKDQGTKLKVKTC